MGGLIQVIHYYSQLLPFRGKVLVSLYIACH